MRAYVPRNLNEDGMVEDTFGNFKNLTKYIRMDDYTCVTQLVEDQRQIIDEQVEENRGLRADVLLLQRENAEQRQEIDRLVKRTWNDNVEFIAQAKENLLQQYVNLTQMYGAQKHEIRDLKEEIARLREVLGKLHSLQNGCPLPKYEAEYLYCIVQVERLLGLEREEHL